MANNYDFTGRVALVTGAGRGIGRSIAMTLAASGAAVAGQDLTPVNLDETIGGILSRGGRARDYIFDLAKKMPVQAMIEQVVEDWGKIDILVNSAQVKPCNSLLEMDEWDWHRTIDVNLGGPFFTMQSVGRVMRDLGGGVIVNIAAVEEDRDSEVFYPAYHASMLGLISLTRQAARELRAYNIRVNALYTGQEIIEASQEVPTPPDGAGSIRLIYNPGKGFEEAVQYLCSPAAAGITGQALHLDLAQAN